MRFDHLGTMCVLLSSGDLIGSAAIPVPFQRMHDVDVVVSVTRALDTGLTVALSLSFLYTFRNTNYEVRNSL